MLQNAANPKINMIAGGNHTYTDCPSLFPHMTPWPPLGGGWHSAGCDWGSISPSLQHSLRLRSRAATSLWEGGSQLFAAKQIDAHLVFECNRSVYWIGESGDYSSLPHEGGGMTKS